MASFKIKFDKPRFEKLVNKLNSLTRDFIDQKTGDQIGFVAVKEMKALIAKGITPIRGGPVTGKFPPYKAHKAASGASKIARSLTGARKNKAKNIAKDAKRGYPYNVQDKFPDKKVTPVNLKLSGDFLDSLTYEWKRLTNKIGRTLIFFNDSYQEDKEYGHRYGANGQPKRPIMPFQNAGEKLAATIDAKIAKILRARLKELLNNK